MRIDKLIFAFALTIVSSAALAQDEKSPVRLGILTDMAGVYSEMSGQGSVEAARLAIEDVGGSVLGMPVEVVVGDHQNKPDVGLGIARRWYDSEGVDVILDVPTSSVALGVAAYANQVGKMAIFTNASSERLTEDQCTATTFLWTWNNYAMTNSLVQSLTSTGAKTWFIIAPDYAYGRSTAETVSKLVQDAGGKVVGSVFHPLNGDDFSSFLLQAQSSKAAVIAFASGGRDIQNLMKQANEFAIFSQGDQKPAMLNNIISDTHSVGLETMKGIRSITPFYWDRNDETRAFAARFSKVMGRVPGEAQTGTYSATLNYLKAVSETGSKDPKVVIEWLRSHPIKDLFAVNAKLLPNGQLIHDMLLVETKSPEQSSYPWDYYKIVDSIPAETAFRPIADSQCPLLKKL